MKHIPKPYGSYIGRPPLCSRMAAGASRKYAQPLNPDKQNDTLLPYQGESFVDISERKIVERETRLAPPWMTSQTTLLDDVEVVIGGFSSGQYVLTAKTDNGSLVVFSETEAEGVTPPPESLALAREISELSGARLVLE